MLSNRPVTQVARLLFKYGWVVLLLWAGVHRANHISRLPDLSFVPDFSINQSTTSQAGVTYFSVSDPHQAPSVHAASIAQIDPNTLQAVWFGGLREGARDVAIYTNTFDLSKKQWGSPSVLLTRQTLQQHSRIYIKKLGNPLLYHSPKGHTHLFVVGVSLGGWAGSRLYHFVNQGDGFVYQSQLILSPFLNNSHLVRNPPIALADGGFYLPIYHEFTQKYELLLRFDDQAKLLTLERPNAQTGLLQPAITALSPSQCLIVRRNHKALTPMLLQSCQSGDPRFGQLHPASFNNDNSSVAITNYRKVPLMIHNTPLSDNSRYRLSLSSLNSTVMSIDTASTELGEVSYPSVLWVGNDLHVIYTYDRQRIKHAIIPSSFIAAHLTD